MVALPNVVSVRSVVPDGGKNTETVNLVEQETYKYDRNMMGHGCFIPVAHYVIQYVSDEHVETAMY